MHCLPWPLRHSLPRASQDESQQATMNVACLYARQLLRLHVTAELLALV